jgi:hypothetical protein
MSRRPAHPSTSNQAGESLARRADRYRLYERAVQCPDAEVDFIAETFHSRRGRFARTLVEDFCGSAAVCCEWVRRDPANSATGIDTDPEVLSWTSRQRLPLLPADARTRLRLLQADVMTVGPGADHPAAHDPADVVVAMNFSWWLISERRSLLGYFQRVRERLTADGLFLLDSYGGYDAFRVITEERPIADDGPAFTYIWDQTDYDPISGMMECEIHFAFPDGSRLERAFAYRWRLWTLPELREVLAEAGFSNVEVYWQGWDANGEPDGNFQPVQRAEPDAGWICYLSAER